MVDLVTGLDQPEKPELLVFLHFQLIGFSASPEEILSMMEEMQENLELSIEEMRQIIKDHYT